MAHCVYSAGAPRTNQAVAHSTRLMVVNTVLEAGVSSVQVLLHNLKVFIRSLKVYLAEICDQREH